VPPVFSSATPTPAATAAPRPKAPAQPVSLNATRNSQVASISGAQRVEPNAPPDIQSGLACGTAGGRDARKRPVGTDQPNLDLGVADPAESCFCVPHGTRLSPRLPTRSKGMRDRSFRAAGFAGRRVFVSPAGHSEADSHGGVIGCGCTGGLDAGGVPSRTRRPDGGF